MINRLTKNKKGSTTLLVFLILTGLLTVSLATANLVTEGLKLSRNQSSSVKSYFAAESGADRILWEVRQGNFDFTTCPDNGNFCVVDFSSGACNNSDCNASFSETLGNESRYDVFYSFLGDKHVFTSMGSFGGTKRAVKVSINANPWNCGDSNIFDSENNSYGTIKIGNTCVMADPLNVGTMINTWDNDSDNGIIEKYCHENDEANCETGGALYYWDEAMNYVTTEGAKGICPAGWHIPTDEEWMEVEEALGMCSGTADGCSGDYDYRGTNEGDKLKRLEDCWTGIDCAASGMDIFLSGSLSLAEHWGIVARLITSTEYELDDTHVWRRYLYDDRGSIRRSHNSKEYPFQVRCFKD